VQVQRLFAVPSRLVEPPLVRRVFVGTLARGRANDDEPSGLADGAGAQAGGV